MGCDSSGFDEIENDGLAVSLGSRLSMPFAICGEGASLNYTGGTVL